jgi:5-methylcytosine-specific restriction protein A
MSRQEFTAKVKVAAFERAAGRCEACTAPLRVGKTHYDHVLPCALGGSPTIENCAVLCASCHGAKTARQDVPQIAKMKRQRAAHIGTKGPSKWRKPPENMRYDWTMRRWVPMKREIDL